MKLYMYYFKDPNIPSFEPRLYAFTSDKEIANTFEQQRDMTKFHKVIRDIKKDEFKYIVDSFSAHKLTQTEFLTKDPNSKTKSIRVPIVCTWDEEKMSVIKSDDIIYMEGSKYIGDINPEILPIDVQEALYKLGFFTLYKFMYTGGYIVNSLSEEFYDGILNSPTTDLKTKSIQVDQLEVFMYFYGNLMK